MTKLNYDPRPPERQDVDSGEPTRRRWYTGWLVLAILIGLTVWTVRSSDDSPGSIDARQSGVVEVVYYVDGTARSADITIETPTGTSQQSVDIPLVNRGGTRGLRFTFSPGSFVYISAQNRGETGTVRCGIEIDGITIAENTSQGAYSIAQCDGSA